RARAQVPLTGLKADAGSVIEVDLSKSMITLAIARVFGLGDGLAARFSGLTGEAAALPVETGSVDLVFSRGSIQFWPNLAGAFDEMRRVLAKGGAAYVGGGYGLSIPREVREEITRRRAERESESGGPSRIPPMDRETMLRLARERGGDVVLLGPPPGFWLHWRPAK
ncbi:MAG TPA: class I SAM-dependent methyltransferase, partial [Candidatus Ozemobacteraceae bacterium]|nr:class I SAM-dependent methyltransferase [Candidatus Ozemobacteraceae bacterium]